MSHGPPLLNVDQRAMFSVGFGVDEGVMVAGALLLGPRTGVAECKRAMVERPQPAVYKVSRSGDSRVTRR